jgi:hypothetical protein
LLIFKLEEAWVLLNMELKSMIFIFIILFAFTACSSRLSPSSTSNTAGTGAMDLQYAYSKLSDISAAASTIVEVEVTDEYETVIHGGLPFTITKVKVISSIKGDFLPNDLPRIIETGGRYRPELKGGAESKEVELSFGGRNVMKSGESLILFLKPFDGPQTTDALVVLGVHQGKLLIHNGKVTPMGQFEDFHGASLDDFKLEVKRLISN